VAVLDRLLPTAVVWLAVQHARGGGGSASGVGQEAAKGRSRAFATFHVARAPPIGLDGGESEEENIQGLCHHHHHHVGCETVGVLSTSDGCGGRHGMWGRRR